MAVQTPPNPQPADAGSMGASDLDRQLDQLIPPSRPSLFRFGISLLVVVAALTVTVLNIDGRLYPRPTDSGSSSSGLWMWLDAERGLVGGAVTVPNWSGRTVRVADATLDAPGVRLVETALWLEPPIPASAADGSITVTDSVEPMTPSDIGPPPEAAALPAEIPSDRYGLLILWFEPTDCEADGSGDWGVAEITVDFGDGAFPPFSRSIRLDDDPIFDRNDGDATVVISGGSFDPSGEVEFRSGPTALAAACEVLS